MIGICSNGTFEPIDGGSVQALSEEMMLTHPVVLAWQSAFRTYDWREAIGDADTIIGEVQHLLSLV
jgi:hypothetical protein